jgi:hypothetical protein
MWKETSKADRVMNNRILAKVRPDLFSRDSLSKSLFKRGGLKGIDESEKYDIQRAMLDNWGSKSGAVEDMVKAGISEGRAGVIYDNETAIAYAKVDQFQAIQKGGAATKTWITHPEDSAKGPCDLCAGMDGETVPLTEAYSSGSKIPHLHIGCVCSEEYGNDEPNT